MSKHTPGPWSLKVHDGDGKTVTANSDWSIHGPEGQVIAMEGYSNPNADGDAHLLAAAQQMYEELDKLDKWWTEDFKDGPDGDYSDRFCVPNDETMAIWRNIRAALKAASGDPQS